MRLGKEALAGFYEPSEGVTPLTPHWASVQGKEPKP